MKSVSLIRRIILELVLRASLSWVLLLAGNMIMPSAATYDDENKRCD